MEEKISEKKEKKEKIIKNKETIKLSSYGSIVFGVGLLIAIISSFLTLEETAKTVVSATLIILGITIGILNVTNKESVPFLLATLVFVSMLQPFLMALVQSFKIANPYILQLIGNLFASFMLLIVPIAIVVALRVIFLVAKDE